MTEPNAELLADDRIPRVTLAGKAWPVRRLALEQNNEVAPILMSRVALLNGTATELAAKLTTEVLNDFAHVVFWGLKRGHPDLTRAEFNDMEIDPFGELVPAFTTVMAQSSLFRPVRTGEATGPLAPAATISPIGSRTPPKSALARAGRGNTSGR